MSPRRRCVPAVVLLLCSLGCLAAAPAFAAQTQPAPYAPPGWPADLKLALPENGMVRLPGDPEWDKSETADFVWEIPGAADGDTIMLSRVAGRKLPASTPDPGQLSDAQITALLTDIATASSGGRSVKLADQPRPVAVGGRAWVRVQATYGDPFLNRNGIIYLTYTPSGYFALAADYRFVVDDTLPDMPSSTSGDAEAWFQRMLDVPSARP